MPSVRLAAGALVAFAFATPAHAQVCPGALLGYSNLTTYTQMDHNLLASGEVNSPEHGNTITLAPIAAPTARRIDVSMRLYGGGVATYDARVRFYANDGPAGAPGTLLWTSGLIHTLADSGAPTGFSTPVPNIALPPTFTWTVQVFNRQGIMDRLTVAEYNPPTVGTAASGVWVRTGPGASDWALTALNEPPFGSRICVVSTPADANCDGAADGLDAAAFAQTMIDPAGFAQQHPGCTPDRADMNCDGVLDADDLSRFVACLLGGSCSCG